MTMGTYQYFREPCALCGEYHPTRDMKRLYMGQSHHSCPIPRKLCSVCDTCFPKLLDFLEVSEPEEPKERPYTRPRWCRKCASSVGKTAKYCPYCGDELASQVTESDLPTCLQHLSPEERDVYLLGQWDQKVRRKLGEE